MKSIVSYWRRAVVLGVFVFICAVGPAGLRAQSDAGAATLTGVVLDKDGKSIQSATVVIKNNSTGLSRKTTTDASGHFSASGLPPGAYAVEASAPGFSTGRREAVQLAAGGAEDLSIPLNVANMSQAVTVEASSEIAMQIAPSQSSLEARSAQSVIGTPFIDNFTAPVADYTEIVQMAPGTFSVSSNGVGLGDSKTYFRGFADGQFTMTYDGIPFNDTNSPTHHSWAFFPSQWIGGTVFDRSPGSASTLGPTNFGGSINLLSREPQPEPDVRASVSYGSFNTRLLDLAVDSGKFLGDKSSLFVDLHELKSDGYQTFNFQKRDAGSLKYQYKLSDKTTVSAFLGIIDLWTNTPNTKGPTRAQVAQFGDNYLLSNDPNRPDYFRYNYYHVQSDFEYIGISTDLGHGWRLDDKIYSYRYWNKQNYNGTTITKTSATDKLNGYRKIGDTLGVSQEHGRGIFRTGIWYEWAYTDRYQVPSDPRTWVNAALPNFHEQFITQSVQPYAEYEFKVTRKLSVTGGVKMAYYQQHLEQFADNGKTVGSLNGVAFVTHTAGYRSWQPSVDANYRLKQNWSVYAQYATGNVIPPSTVFDVKNAVVAILPKPTQAKTYQVGTVWKNNRVTFDFDAYHTHFQNPYSASPDPTTGEPVYFATGDSVTKGIEAEGNVRLGLGFYLYLNGTAGNAKYVNTERWVQNAPRNTETVGLTYQRQNWDLGFFNKRIGQMYNDNGSTNEAVTIKPFNITNVFLNYTIKSESRFRDTKIRLSVNNLLDKHSIVGVTPAATTTSVAAPGDVLTLMPGRSVALTVTFGYAPKR
ncbi:MAG: TonB-dependent receptor [Bryobacterales bacterium]|nr:TonB-dependent receptor [Bryobacterales bacterium]